MALALARGVEAVGECRRRQLDLLPLDRHAPLEQLGEERVLGPVQASAGANSSNVTKQAQAVAIRMGIGSDSMGADGHVRRLVRELR